MTEQLTGYEASSVAEIEAILDAMPADADQVYLDTIGYSERAIAAVAAKRAGGSSFPAQWTVDPDTGTLVLDLTLDSSLQDVDAFTVTINSSMAFRVFLGQDGTPQVSIDNLNLGSVWRNEQSDSFPSLQVADEGDVRSKSLPTSDPGNLGELWVDVPGGRVVKSSAG